jgi:hypothetical protein
MLTERNYGGEFLISEAGRTRSREQVTIGESQDLAAGAVLGKSSLGDITVGAAAAVGTNSSGNGTFSAPSGSAGLKAGDWIVEFNDATHFVIHDPAGVEVGHGVAGTAYAGAGPHFTFTAGGTAQVAGDLFKIPVSYADGDGSYGAIDPAAADGRAVAAGILWDKVTTGSGENAQATIIARDAEVDGALLGFGTLNDTQKAAAKADLSALGIIVR